MSKAVLIMEMPENCCECRLHTGYSCLVHGPEGARYRYKRAEWCPLRKLPEKREIPSLENEYDWHDSGWNACLDAIEGR